MKTEEIKARLAALRPGDIKTPTLPMAHALQEANDLAKHCSKAEIKERLIAVGMSTDFVEELTGRIEVAREAQAEWNNIRDVAKSRDLVAAEKEAHELRADLIAACRFNLKGSEDEARLNHILAGDSTDDLVQDLFDLAKMLENNVPAFARDTLFDAKTKMAEARNHGERLSSYLSEERYDVNPSAVREYRDRAFTLMDDLVTEVRSAGRYAFRTNSAALKHFTSRYRRRTRGTRGARTTDVVPQDVVADAPASA